jgi:opacity protein-like surface antigen
MRRFIVAALAVAGAIGTANAGEEAGFYVGFDAGQSSVDLDQRGLDNSLIGLFNDLGFAVLDGSSETSEDSFTFGLILGYQVLPWLALEATYMDLGEAEYKARGTISDGVAVASSRFDFKGSAKGPAVSVIGMYPFANGWSVLGRAGMVFTDIDYDINVSVEDQSSSQSISRSNENFLWGAGVGFTALPWTVRLEYQQISDLGDKDVAGEADGSRVTLATIFRF